MRHGSWSTIHPSHQFYGVAVFAQPRRVEIVIADGRAVAVAVTVVVVVTLASAVAAVVGTVAVVGTFVHEGTEVRQVRGRRGDRLSAWNKHISTSFTPSTTTPVTTSFSTYVPTSPTRLDAAY